MTAVETPAGTEPAPAAQERLCPRCGAPLRPEQEWCLNCGAGIGARVAPPRGWRWPVAVVAGLLALVLVAFVLVVVELAGDAEKVGQATPTPAAQPTAAPAPSSTADPTQIPPASGGTASPPQVSEWPAGKTGYTVILESSSTSDAAAARAKELAAQGIPTGVLDSSGYTSLTPDRYVVFSGQYETRADARLALRGLRKRIQGAKVGRVAPA